MNDDLGGSGDVGGLVGPRCQLVQSRCIGIGQKLALKKLCERFSFWLGMGPCDLMSIYEEILNRREDQMEIRKKGNQFN